MIVRLHHVREARLCLGGARQWFKANNLSWQDFLDNGIEGEKLREIGDPIGLRVLEIAERENA